MQLTINKLILWPNDDSLGPKVIEFKKNKINIITGQSQTGKSAITWIVDYCLGSNKCTVPVGIIRNCVSWFGLHISFSDTELVLARKNPGPNQASADMYMEEGTNIEVPTIPFKNCSAPDIKAMFNHRSGLSGLDFRSGDSEAPYQDRASFRDLAAFNFQPQHIVANPFTLFFKADTFHHREKLKTIFPLVLGIVDNEYLKLQQELKEIQFNLKKLNAELEIKKKAVESWKANIQGYYSQALELGLIANPRYPQSDWPIERYISILSSIPKYLDTKPIPSLIKSGVETAIEEIVRLEKREDELVKIIGDLRRRIANMKTLAKTIDQYENELTSQLSRTEGIDWFRKALSKGGQCPLCNSENIYANNQIEEVEDIILEVESISQSIAKTPGILDKDISQISHQIGELLDELDQIRIRRKSLQDESKELAQQRLRVSNAYRLAGKIEQMLISFNAVSEDSDLNLKISNLLDRSKEINSKIDPILRHRKEKNTIERIGRMINEFADTLELERKDDIITLNIRDLTLEFLSSEGRSDYLWELGSGQNWVGYHLSTLFALHKWFIESTKLPSPVPTFIIIDQPSQVYFPEAWPDAEEIPEAKDDKNKQKLSKDILGVQRIFSVMERFLKELDSNFQIIVTEHAGNITWKDIDLVHLVGNWREGHDEFLIPQEWINKLDTA